MLFSEQPQVDMYVLHTRDSIAQFCTDVMSMNNLDYDIHELLSLIVRSLSDFEHLEDELEDVIEGYRGMTQLGESATRDFNILEPAIRKLHAGIRSQLDFFDVRDSTGVLEYRYADLRSNNDLLLVHRNYQYSDSGVTSYPAPSFDPLTPRSNVTLSELLGPDDGYAGTDFIGVINPE